MKKKHLLSLIYVLLALGFVINGLIMLLAPGLWLAQAPFQLQASSSTEYLVRTLGLADLAMAPLFLWCARNLKKRKSVHFALAIYVVGFAVLNAIEIVLAPVISGGIVYWLSLIGMVFLPAVLMVAMALPPLPTRVKGPRETGTVKWFNATKGFGFITRAHGDDVFVHYRSIRGEGHRTLREDQSVEFVVVKGDKGLQAEDVQAL